jgi:hypothetical protein
MAELSTAETTAHAVAHPRSGGGERPQTDRNLSRVPRPTSGGTTTTPTTTHRSLTIVR